MADNRTYENIPAGLAVRQSIGKEFIFRRRTGNNYYGTKLGHPVQDKYAYVVPNSINNPEAEPQRRQLNAAVQKWVYDLTDLQKEEYNARAHRNLRMSGYNLFMHEAMTGLVDMFVDRGDPATYDFLLADLTTDGSWHDLDLTLFVAKSAKLVLLAGHVEGLAVDWEIMFRKKSNVNEVNHGGMETIRSGVERHRSVMVAINRDQIIQYKADDEAWDTLSLTVRGWWS